MILTMRNLCSAMERQNCGWFLLQDWLFPRFWQFWPTFRPATSSCRSFWVIAPSRPTFVAITPLRPIIGKNCQYRHLATPVEARSTDIASRLYSSIMPLGSIFFAITPWAPWAKRAPPSVDLWLNFLPVTILPTKQRLSLNISSYN